MAAVLAHRSPEDRRASGTRAQRADQVRKPRAACRAALELRCAPWLPCNRGAACSLAAAGKRLGHACGALSPRHGTRVLVPLPGLKRSPCMRQLSAWGHPCHARCTMLLVVDAVMICFGSFGCTGEFASVRDNKADAILDRNSLAASTIYYCTADLGADSPKVCQDVSTCARSRRMRVRSNSLCMLTPSFSLHRHTRLLQESATCDFAQNVHSPAYLPTRTLSSEERAYFLHNIANQENGAQVQLPVSRPQQHQTASQHDKMCVSGRGDP